MVCGEFEKDFRRITRKDGETVYRCTDRVKTNKQAVCQKLHTVSYVEARKAICNLFETDQFDEEEFKRINYRIEIDEYGIRCFSQAKQLFEKYM